MHLFYRVSLVCFCVLLSLSCHCPPRRSDRMSVYAQSVATTLLVVLKALHNSQHIHDANSSDFHTSLEARERVNQEKLRLKTICKEDRTRQSYLSYFYSVRNCLCVSVCVRGSAERERQLTGRSSGCRSRMRMSLMPCQGRRRSVLSSREKLKQKKKLSY